MRVSLLEFLEEEFKPSEASLISAPSAGFRERDTVQHDFPFEELFDAVLENEVCPHPDSDGWFCVPLHSASGPLMTQEYVVFLDHQLRGEHVLLADCENADEITACSPVEFGAFAIANRLRFWHPHHEKQGRTKAIQWGQRLLAEGRERLEREEYETARLLVEDARQLFDYVAAVDAARPSSETDTTALQKEVKRLSAEVERKDCEATVDRYCREGEKAFETGIDKLSAGELEAAQELFRTARTRYQTALDEASGTLPTERIDAIQTARDEAERFSTKAERKDCEATVDQYCREGEDALEAGTDKLSAGEFEAAQELFRTASARYQTALDEATGTLSSERIDAIQAARDEADSRAEKAQEQIHRQHIEEYLETTRERLETCRESLAVREFERAREFLKSADEYHRMAREYAEEHGLDIEELEVLSAQLSNADKRIENQQALAKVADIWDAAQTQRERARKAQEEEDDERALKYLTAATREIRTALEKAEGIDCIDSNQLEETVREIADHRSRLRTKQASRQRQEELQDADEILSRGEEALENGSPVEALKTFQAALTEYRRIRDETSGAATQAVSKAEARIAASQRAIEQAKSTCEEAMEDLIERAESLENQDHDMIGGENSTEAHQLYRDAAKIAKEAGLDRAPELMARLRTKKSKNEMRNRELASARTELNEHLVSCQRAVRDAVTALENSNIDEATSKYGVALRRAIDAYQLVSVTDFGTTPDIEQHNKTLLYQNCERLADHLDAIEQEGLTVDPLTTQQIQGVTEHFKPEKIPESGDTVERFPDKSESENQREETEVVWTDFTDDKDVRKEATADDNSILDEIISSFNLNEED